MQAEYYKTKKGHPFPYGATKEANGINFALVSPQASRVTLLLLDPVKKETLAALKLDPQIHRTGNVWHIFVETKKDVPLSYAYQVETDSTSPQESSITYLDPYAKAVDSSVAWSTLCCGDQASYHPSGLILPLQNFDWENDHPLQIPVKDLIIYEMHVRGFTQDPSSKVKAPGTFLGVIEKIPHLLELGINAVELMPVHEFNECEYRLQNPLVHKNLYQYWGYSSVNFFAPMNRFAFDQRPGKVIQEFKLMVKELHKNGIEVILDIVLNHTNEGNESGPANSFKGIDKSIYYQLSPEGNYLNFTGCGNTFNVNHPVTQQFLLDVLRYWVVEMHVDGFRFDLASIFYRGVQGEILSRSPLIEAISQDPILSHTLLIAEPWDAVGLYQVGHFYPKGTRWSEWNASYRDTVRRFIKGNPNLKAKLASRLSGSQDIYSSQAPTCSINFIVAHDGFTLHDLVSYNQKHNLANGENNHDGLNDNDSWNCGYEGVTQKQEVIKLRERQMRNFHLTLMLSQGIPMLLMADEYAHTKKGNNNTWCHDSELNWFLWDKLLEKKDFFRFYKNLIHFRKQHSLLRKGSFLTKADVTWWSKDGNPVLWDKDTHFLAFTLHDIQHHEDLFIAFNAQNEYLRIKIPDFNDKKRWHLIVDTANEPPEDFFETGHEPILVMDTYTMQPFSSMLLKKL